MNKIPHDKFFKNMMSKKEVAIDFFRDNLPAHVMEKIDLSTIELQKESFIEEDLKQQFADLIFKVNIDQHEGYLYLLLEHQSTIDQLMPFRLWKYIFAMMERFIGTSKKRPSFPVIVPLVIYQGKDKYSACLNIWDLFEDPILAKKVMSDDHILIDVHRLPDEELMQRRISGIIEYMMKNISSNNLLMHVEKLWIKLR